MESFHLSVDAVQDPVRRSISIFSRHGIDTPQPPIKLLSSTIMTSANNESRKQSTWKKRLGRLNKREAQATILHAVPSAIAIPSMTPLEKVMVTSPNEEILNAIGKGTIYTSLPALPSSQEWNESPRSPKTKNDESKIGIWQDGMAIWDTPSQQSRPLEILNVNAGAPAQRLNVSENDTRPNLLVVIPGGESSRRVRPSCSPRSRYILPQIPIDMSSFNITIPSMLNTTTGSAVLSPISMIDESAIHPAFRSNTNFLEGRLRDETPGSHRRGPSASESLAASRSSTTSSTVFEEVSDEGSVYSRNSSTTSVEEEEEANDMLHDSERNQLHVHKRSVSSAFSIRSPVAAGVFDEQHPATTTISSNQCPPSPTLSEVVQDLHTQLDSISEDGFISQEMKYDQTPSILIQPPTSLPTDAPAVPKKSRKREWVSAPLAMAKPTPSSQPPADPLVRRLSVPSNVETLGQHVHSQSDSGLRRAISARLTADATIDPPACELSLGSAQLSLLLSAITSLQPPLQTQPSAASLSPDEAHAVLLRIMSHLETIEDLQAMSMINRGMRQIYKATELCLLKTVLWNKSPAAWELREWSSVPFAELDVCAAPQRHEHSPSTYIPGMRQDDSVIKELKVLILERCQSFLRNETVAALTSDEDMNSRRFDDAFYRLWCFCKIFGCDKEREDDVTGQLDWLRGGLLAHQQDCAATVCINLDFEMGGVLLNAPEYFAKGNGGGLTASQLYDMTEVWNCLAALLAGYNGRTGQARHHGIYDPIGVKSGNIAEEEAVMEEWMTYILTLGPPVVLELAKFSEDNSDAGFKVAKFNGWTEWALSSSGNSRSTFFREPVARLYEERMSTASTNTTSAARERKEVGRKRVASLAAEIKLARCSSSYQRLPLIDMAHERPMSVLGRRDSHMPLYSCSPTSAASTLSQYGSCASRKVSPIIEDRVDSFNRLSLLSMEGVAEDTVDRAVAKIVAMGYPASRAEEALRLTDMGDGLRPDRAVDYLLRQQ